MRAIDADAFDERVRVAVGMSEEELTEDFKDGVQAVLYMLSNQPTIDVSTVDRQAAVDMLMERASNLRGIVGDLGGACSGAAKLIMQIPSAEPKRIRGHWIPVTNGREGHECDLCHEYAPSFESGNEYLSNFCPNCGAKMEVTE